MVGVRESVCARDRGEWEEEKEKKNEYLCTKPEDPQADSAATHRLV